MIEVSSALLLSATVCDAERRRRGQGRQKGGMRQLVARLCLWWASLARANSRSDKEGRSILLQLSAGRCVPLALKHSGSTTVGMSEHCWSDLDILPYVVLGIQRHGHLPFLIIAPSVRPTVLVRPTNSPPLSNEAASSFPSEMESFRHLHSSHRHCLDSIQVFPKTTVF